MLDKNNQQSFSDMIELKKDFNNFASERAFSAESTFFDNHKYEYFDNKLTDEEVKKQSIREFDKSIAVYKRGFLDAILLFSK